MTPTHRGTDPQDASSPDVVREALLAIAAGDSEAFAALYDATSARVYGLVLRVLRDPSQSEEVTQEVYLEVYRRAASFDPTRGSALGWIMMITHRRAVDRVRSSQSQSDRDLAYESRSQAGDPDPTGDTVLESLDAQEVHRALGQLSERQGAAIRLAYLDGLTHTQVASRLDIPLGTAKTRIRDGLLALRTTISTARQGKEES